MMQEVPLLPWWFTLSLAVWAAIGPLAGILIGHYLTRSWQREQRIADDRKAEYRRLLAALNQLNMILVDAHTFGQFNIEQIKPAVDEVSLSFNTSLFLMEFLTQSKIAGDVLDAVTKLIKGGDIEDYNAKYWEAVNLIMADAKKHVL